MTAPRKLVSNTAIVVIGSASQRLLHFATTVLLARGLGDEQFGIYSFVVAYMFIFGFLVDLGFERIITREVVRRPERAGQLLGTGLIIRVAMSVVAAALAIAIAVAVHLPALTRSCIVVAALGMPLSVEILVRGFFQSRYEMHYTYLLTLPGQVVFVVLAGVAIHLGGGLIAVMLISLATGVLTVALILWVAVPKMALVWRLDWGLVRYLMRESWQLGAVILLSLLSMRLDQILLYWLRGPVDVGLYAVAVKIAEASNIIPESVMVTVFPLLASTEHSAPERFERIYLLTVRYLIVLVVPLALLVTLAREPLIGVLFGARYVAGAPAVAVLAWWLFFPYTGAVYLNLMIVRGQQRLMGIVSLAAVIVNLVLNLILIPRWGGAGAAAATLASSATSFALFGLVAETRAVMRVCYVEALRPLAAAVGAVMLLWWIPSPNLRLFAAVPLYVTLLLALGGIKRRDWVWMGALWRPATPRA